MGDSLSEKFALLIQCGTQKSHKVPLSAVHKFDEAKHSTLQAYKFNTENEVLYGTISFIANTAQEVDQVLEAGRLRKPPKRFVEPALETTDTEAEVEQRRKPVQQPKRKVTIEDSLNSRLTNLKNQQSEKRQHVTPQIQKTLAFPMELSGGELNRPKINNNNDKDQLSNQLSNAKQTAGTHNGMTHQENEKIKRLSIFKNSAAVKPPQAVKPHSTAKSPATIRTPVRSNTSPKTNTDTSETVHSQPVLQPPASVTRNNAFADSMMKKNALNLLEMQKKVSTLTTSLQYCQKKLQDSNLEKEVLRQQLEEIRSASLELENQLRETQDDLKRVRTLNEEWQEISMQKCDLIHAMFSEIRSSFKEQGGDEPNVPVGNVTDNHIHLGRGVWIPHDVYSLACYEVNMKTKKTFVRKMLVALFGYDLLAESTVTGRTSNRSKAKKVPVKHLEPKKVRAIKDIYKYFLIKVLGMDPHEAETEADKTNLLISKKVAQIKRQHEKPDKDGRRILGNVEVDVDSTEHFQEIANEFNNEVMEEIQVEQEDELGMEMENPLQDPLEVQNAMQTSQENLVFEPEEIFEGQDTSFHSDNEVAGAVKEALDTLNAPGPSEAAQSCPPGLSNVQDPLGNYNIMHEEVLNRSMTADKYIDTDSEFN